eukprot:COSAG01_NODE_436_length_17063_cov_42.157628_15_plen_492_part_00
MDIGRYLTTGEKKALGIRDHDTLAMLLLLIKYTALGWTEADVKARWTFVKSACLPKMRDATHFTAHQHAQLIAYVEERWLCDFWLATWTHMSRHGSDTRLRTLATTNNSVECFWKAYLKFVCEGSMFKRRDDEARKIACDATNLLDNLALTSAERPSQRTLIKTDVHYRTVLALAIIVRNGVRRGPNGIYYVRAGLSSRKLLHFGSHRPDNVEVRSPSRLRHVWNEVRVELRTSFEARGADPDLGWGTYCYHPALGCECVDSTYRGQQRGGCKHQLACNLFRNYGDNLARAAAIRDIAHAMREREKRTPRELQVQEVLSESDLEVWDYLDSIAPVVVQHSSNEGETRPRRTTNRVDYHALATNCHVATRAVSSLPPSVWRGDFATGSDEDEGQEDAKTHHAQLFDRLEKSLTACGKMPTEDSVRAGRRTAIEDKQRQQWRQADKHRPKFGLKLQSRLGGIAAVHRVDASKQGRDSRLTKAARNSTAIRKKK